MTDVTPRDFYNVTYVSACGIKPIAFQPITCMTTVTPYGAFPVILANTTVGLAWYLQMLQGPRMQGPLGTTESVNIVRTTLNSDNLV